MTSLIDNARVDRANAGPDASHLRVEARGRAFASRVATRLRRSGLRAGKDAFFGYSVASLEVFEMLTASRIPTVLSQIDAGRVDEDAVHAEFARWPGWEAVPTRIPNHCWHRVDEEWRLATGIVVNSEWTHQALVKQGVPASKLRLIPLSFDPAAGVDATSVNTGEFRVLFLGKAALRKGIQYLIEAARMLDDAAISYTVVGPVSISEDAIRSAPATMRFVGRVSRAETEAYYRDADIFVFPTVSDGFGMAQLEAMSYGLPVISTPNCATVVRDQVDGFVVPAGDSVALAQGIAKIVNDRALLADMSAHAIRRARDFSLQNYESVLAIQLETLLSG